MSLDGSLSFSAIPKAFGFEAATRFTSILMDGSLIPIVVYRDGDGFLQPYNFKFKKNPQNI
ncbi:MAG: hypothetical protein A2168_09175 [Planctomycetes bacterium RBG_13_50_24]|nr:MAG: hypothetical protein A2168_09175 [Planctomycetes bacterium RBG_13_50_24]